MPAFRVSGTTGQAPTTSFFGAVPDKYNMLMPGHPGPNGGPNQGNSIDNAIAANLVSSWTIYNPTVWGGTNTASASFTGGQTAPDGTTTAAKMVESTLNDIHMATAGWRFGGGQVPGDFIQAGSVFRTAVFAKAAGRTRFSLAFGSQGQHTNGGYQNLQSGTRVIFDLAGGQIGRAGATFGTGTTGWNVLASSITPFGNGWFLCQFDANIGSFGGVGNQLYCGVIIDSGSGTAAESTSYTGDGASGIIFWRATHLPAQAWGMSNQPVFVDDFDDNTMAEFDKNNTQAPGFKWYYNGNWAGPGYRTSDGAKSPIAPNFFTVSGSAITLPSLGSVGAGSSFYLLSPATWLGGTSFLGQTFTSPMIVEEKVKWDTASNTASPGGNSGNFFTDVLKQLLTPFPVPIGDIGYSWSPIESLHNISSTTTMFMGPSISHAENINLTDGIFNSLEWMQNPTSNAGTYGIWYNAIQYGGGTSTIFDTADGNIYKNIGTPIVGTAPHLDVVNWALHDPTTDGLPTKANSIIFDYTVYHTYVTIWMRTDPVYGPGHTLTFVDGIFGQYIGSYTKNQPPFWAEGLPGNLFLLGADNYANICDRMAIYQ
jgi:hypothetical protein